MWATPISTSVAGLLACVFFSAVSAATTSSPYSPTSDPGIYPGGNINPPDGWTTLPAISGATIDNSSLVVGNGSATLVHYIDATYDASKIKRAVIQIHGENRDAWNQWLYSDLAAKRAATGGSFTRDEVVVMAPMFFNTADEGAYPFDRDLNNTTLNTTISYAVPSDSSSPTRRAEDYARDFDSTGYKSRPAMSELAKRRNPPPLERISTSKAMIWKSVEWGDGSPCYEPSDAQGAGSFDALDAAVAFFLDKSRFPELRKVVIAGFSLGAQLTNRYATFRSNTAQDGRIIYWISSPNSFVYLQDSRPIPPDVSCPQYNDYKYGLGGTLPDYYTRSGDKLSTQDLITRYLSRSISYLCGSKDNVAGNTDCAANLQGAHHVSKMYHWTQSYLPNLPGSTEIDGTLPTNSLLRWVQGAGHEDWKIITSDPGVETLWLQQFFSNGESATAPSSNGVVAGVAPSTVNAAGRGTQFAFGTQLLSAAIIIITLLCL